MKHSVVWRGTEDEARETFAFGRKWEANVPQDIDDSEHQVIEEAHRIDKDDGTFTLVQRKRKLSFIEQMRNNPCFDVGGETKEHKRRGRPPKYPNAALEDRAQLVVGE